MTAAEPPVALAAPPLRVLFSVRPFRGHLHPLIPLVRAFAKAGHRVAVASGDDVASVVTNAGLCWFPAGLNPRQAHEVFPDDHPDYGYPVVRSKVEDLVEIAVSQFRADVMIREPTDLAPAIASEIVDAVHVTYGVANFIPPSSWRELGADRTIAALRREYRLLEDPELDCLYRHLYLAVVPPMLESHHPLPVPAVQNLRYVPWDGDFVDRADFASPFGNRRPTVLVTLGTVYNTHSALFQQFLEALAGEDLDVICTVGEDGDVSSLGPTPTNVHFEHYRPHSSILPLCQAVLCHAGFNTMMGSLSAGVPLVCVPLGSDQEFNARRCAAKGLGLWLDEHEATPELIRAAVRRVLDEPSFGENVRALQQRMTRRAGLSASVRRIETMVAARR
jgi:UDP:flavonoid glycosyltransferase YjiC (YdhE family)